uniref:Uncharacterized protein n=1 Tax=Hyaloperonospora arabidopsidis (strain Emoy2) TaxID=559515 RepID=M4C1B4_HYAAE
MPGHFSTPILRPCSASSLKGCRGRGSAAGVLRSQPQFAGADGTGKRLYIVCCGHKSFRLLRLRVYCKQEKHAGRGDFRR